MPGRAGAGTGIGEIRRGAAARCLAGFGFVLLTGACGSGSSPPANGQSGAATVIEVLDGDTIIVALHGAEDRVRLIGIDAPERGECFADRASEGLAALVDGATVTLVADTRDRDAFDRLLRYVFIGDVFVNEAVVDRGLAIARSYPPDTTRQTELDAAADRARARAVGLWDPAACGAAPTADLTVTAINADPPGDDTLVLDDEWIVVTNTGAGAVDLTGWAVRDESASHRYRFPDGFELAAGDGVTLRTGCGTDTRTDLHWCAGGSAVWNNSGDTVFVLDPAGNIVTSHSY